MRKALVVNYFKRNKYSFNVLIGALETDEYFDDLAVYFSRSGEELIKNLGEAIGKHEKVIVALSFMTPQFWEIKELMERLRKFKERVSFVAGGPHPTGDPEGTLRLGFDVVVRGEGEETFKELLKRIYGGEGFEDLKGISFLENGEVISNKPRRWVDLNDYPPFPLRYKRFGPIEITRGCPYGCFFCQTPRIFGSWVRHRSAENILKYVKVMRENKKRDVRFISPNAFSYGSPDGKRLNLERLEEMIKGVKETINPGRIFFGSFPSEVRPEHVNEETLRVVREYASNNNLVIGAQSGSQRVLELCHRGHGVEDIYQAVELTLKSGLKANVDFIFGLPGEEEEDVRKTLEVMEDLMRMGARIHAHFFLPLPGTPFAREEPKWLAKEVRKRLEKWASEGKLYGEWKKQEEFARRMWDLMTS